MTVQKRPRSAGTHDGAFHADEVTACALLLVMDLIDREKIVRTRDPEKLASCWYVCDVGGIYDPERCLFDHHQLEYNGSMSSAGQVLLYLKDRGLIKEGCYDYLRSNLIRGVDDHDNGKDPQLPGVCTYSHIIAGFVPYDDSVTDEIFDRHFFEALEFAVGHLTRIKARYDYMQECRDLVRQAMEGNGECLEFDRYIPWQEMFFELGGAEHPAKFIIMPSGKHWKLRGVPPNLREKMKVRIPLPEEWAGLLKEELASVSGIEGAVFCHKGRFISVWKTKEDAERALDYVLRRERL